jgi:hypothetical protein
MIWIGPTPGVILHDPKLVREVLSNKFGHIKIKELPSRFIKLIGKGLASHQGEKWVVHRKIINHAFLLEKLKVRNEFNYSDDDYSLSLKPSNIFAFAENVAGVYCMHERADKQMGGLDGVWQGGAGNRCVAGAAGSHR